MPIRKILVPLSGGAASEGAIETGCQLAQRFGAHVEALHVAADPRQTLPLLGQDISAPVAAELIDLAMRQSQEASARAKAVFDAVIARNNGSIRQNPLGVAQVEVGTLSAEWREEVGDASAMVPRRARLADLVVLGQSGRIEDKPYTDTTEATILQGGRPVLLASAGPILPIGNIIAIAWNDSPEAARAVAAAMPFLEQAAKVHILMAHKDDDSSLANTDLADYLAWHGIGAVSHVIRPVPGVGTGELVLSAARDCGADLMVMGGYGHAPWREMIFGGATRQILGTSRLPVLLAH